MGNFGHFIFVLGDHVAIKETNSNESITLPRFYHRGQAITEGGQVIHHNCSSRQNTGSMSPSHSSNQTMLSFLSSVSIVAWQTGLNDNSEDTRWLLFRVVFVPFRVSSPLVWPHFPKMISLLSPVTQVWALLGLSQNFSKTPSHPVRTVQDCNRSKRSPLLTLPKSIIKAD